MTDYKDSFKDELPELESEREKKMIRAAVLRFIAEIKKEVIANASQVGTVTETGEITVETTPITVIKEKPERRIAYITNTGQIDCVVYANDGEGYLLKAGREISVFGTNPVDVATVSGISFVSYLDS